MRVRRLATKGAVIMNQPSADHLKTTGGTLWYLMLPQREIACPDPPRTPHSRGE
jgi:hypothetical protein